MNFFDFKSYFITTSFLHSNFLSRFFGLFCYSWISWLYMCSLSTCYFMPLLWFISFYVSILVLCFYLLFCIWRHLPNRALHRSTMLCIFIVIISMIVVFPVYTSLCDEYSFVLVQFCQWMFYRIVQLEIWGRVLTMAADSWHPGPLLNAWILS